MKEIRAIIWCVLISLFSLEIMAQEVLVSQEISIRRDYSYEIIGKVDEQILVFRDMGFDFEVNYFSEDLVYEGKRELSFEKKKIEVLGIVPDQNDFTLYYMYRQKNDEFLMARKYDSGGEMIDSSTLEIIPKSLSNRRYGFTHSEDKKKVLLFHADRDKSMHTYVIDNDSLYIDYIRDVVFDETSINRDFRDLLVSNRGEVFMLFEKDNVRFKKDKHKLEIYELSMYDESIYKTDISYDELLSIDFGAHYDNRNDQLIVGGLYSDNSSVKSQGYYYQALKRGRISSDKKFNFVPFPEQLLKDIHGKKYESNKTLSDFKIKEIISRNDGGAILIAELDKKLTRRNAYPGSGARSDYYIANGGWTDYYNEDVIMMGIHPDGELHWHSVLYKKQFSQDDDIAFSSFFLFKNPSMLRVIYNDEIKKNNTVSEYVIDPLGRKKRRSLLSTEYQSLQLRFNDALQITSNEFIVPSERSGKMSLVKVKY